jgi:hypothetical protein
MPLLKKNMLVAVKREAVEGTYLAPDPALDVKLISQDVIFKTEPTLIERNFIGPSFARKESIVSNRLARITFKTEVVGSGAAGTEPTWSQLITACGFKVTTSAGVSNTYDPVNPLALSYDSTGANGNVSLSIAVFEDGVIKRARGCRGTVRLTGEAGGFAYLEWEFLGIFVSAGDVAYPTLSTGFDSSTATIPRVENASFTFQGEAATDVIIKTFTIDIGNNITPRYDVSQSDGILAIIVNDRAVTGSIDPEQTLAAIFDPVTKLYSALVGAFNLTIGTTAGNRLVVTAPAAKCQITDVDESDRDNLMVNNLSLQFSVPLLESATDKEIRFALT